jgi:DNA-binding transcriptional regulator YiaG
VKHTIDGGTYRSESHDLFDLTPYADLSAKIAGMPVKRCSVCGNELVDGAVLERALDMLALTLVAGKEGLLRPREAVFLRKRMGLTQAELAKNMGCNRVTLARWESTPSISPANDLVLRTVFLADAGARMLSTPEAGARMAAVDALDEVRHRRLRGAPPVMVDSLKHRRASNRAAS